MEQRCDVIGDLVNEHPRFESLLKDFFTTRDPYNQRLILDSLLRATAIHLSIEKIALSPLLLPCIPEDKQLFESVHKKVENLVRILAEWIATHLDHNRYIPSEWPAWPATIIIGLKTALSELKVQEIKHVTDVSQYLSLAEQNCLHKQIAVVIARASGSSVSAILDLSFELKVATDQSGGTHTKGLSLSYAPCIETSPTREDGAQMKSISKSCEPVFVRNALLREGEGAHVNLDCKPCQSVCLSGPASP